MAAIISRERAKATWLTGAVGLLILAAAFVMMACAPPSLVHARPHGAVTQAARAYTSSVITESWSANRAGRSGQVRHSRLGSAHNQRVSRRAASAPALAAAGRRGTADPSSRPGVVPSATLTGWQLLFMMVTHS